MPEIEHFIVSSKKLAAAQVALESATVDLADIRRKVENAQRRVNKSLLIIEALREDSLRIMKREDAKLYRTYAVIEDHPPIETGFTEVEAQKIAGMFPERILFLKEITDG